MTVIKASAVCCALAAAGPCVSAAAQGADEACGKLFSEAAAQLATEDYERMLDTAEAHLRRCPGPKSALLIGLAEAHRVDAQLIADPPRREQARVRALHYLRVAATQGQALPSEWLLSVGEWIVSLQQRGPVATVGTTGEENVPLAPAWSEVLASAEVFEVPAAPPPRAQPRFPWGPMVTMVVGAGALSTGLVLALNANDRFGDVRAGAELLHARKAELSEEGLQQRLEVLEARRDEAQAYQRAATWCAIGGGAALAAGLAWYWLLPPAGKWRWAVTPSGLSATVRF